ncbi:HPP family protein [Paracoccus sp. 11-3]|uniref:HPP family protein n=1 Tax=Paracoccus amoyensis TaxID=2760093 RepID=A0A926GHQ6_9RHOB|nr:HPP family protein [Paracoccus amoyensis]MBC9248477.1 HPP family protein [Paracoccus amoyensis]
MTSSLTRVLRALGPAIPSGPTPEAFRAGLGALIGLAAVSLFLLVTPVDYHLGLYLIPPFGATAVLIFAVPSSPLAQPWSAVMGNTVSALVAVAVCLTVPDPTLRLVLSVGLAITAMILIRALHPPGGAVAMTAAMSPDAIRDLGFWFVLCPVALGTVMLVCVAVIYARLTGRHYPFRQFEDQNTHGTDDHVPTERLGLSKDELTDILAQYRQSLNLGVEDLARLIAAAEMQAAGHRTGPTTVADIMSRDLVTVGPDAPLDQVAEQFRQHGFTSLPVVGTDDRFLGVIFQLHLIRKGLSQQMAPLLAEQIMSRDVPTAAPDTMVAALLPLMADGETDAVPVLDQGRIVGIVTRTDLIAALARESLKQPAD